MKSLSVATVLYNEGRTVPELIARITAVEQALTGVTIGEIVAVDDGSTDDTLLQLKLLHSEEPRLKVISLSRNFGHQTALSCALDHTHGDAVILMDGDLQDPPEVIPEFVRAWQGGADIVYGTRTRRNGETWFKRVSASLFYRTLSMVSEITIPRDTGDFCLLDRRVVGVLTDMPERNRFLRGLRSWVGFTSAGVPYVRDARHEGTTKYSLNRMLRLATTGVLGFSMKPLRLASWLGLVIATMSGAAALVLVYLKLTSDAPFVTGWASLMVVLFFMSGVQLALIGILGEYIGRIYDEVRGRPLYVVRNKIGFDQDS